MALKHRHLGSHTMQKSQLKRETKSLAALKDNSHIGIWILILCKSRIVILHRLVTYYGVCYYLEERSKELAALGRWSVGLAVCRELNAALPPLNHIVADVCIW